MINGQGLGETARLKYGLFPMSFNGCEVIAVCNALEYAGIPFSLNEVRLYMERYSVLFGFFGCNVYRIGSALRHFGMECSRVKDVKEADAFIVSSWTGRQFLSSVHTVFCVRRNGRITVYNRYNRCPDAKIYDSPEDIFSGCRTIVCYIADRKGVF